MIKGEGTYVYYYYCRGGTGRSGVLCYSSLYMNGVATLICAAVVI